MNPVAPTRVRWHIVALLVGYSFMTWFNRVSMSAAYDEHIKNDTDISPEMAGAVYSTFFFCYLVCMVPGGWLIDWIGPKRALVFMGLGSGLFGALTGLAGAPLLVGAGLMLPALFLMRACMGVCSAPIYPGAGRMVHFWLPPRQRTWANGLVQAGAAIGIAGTFYVFGALMDLVGWPTAFAISGGVTMLLAMFMLVYATDRPDRHPKVNEAELHLLPHGGHSHGSAATAHVAHEPWWRLLLNRSLVLLTITYGAVNYVEYLFFHWMHHYFEDVMRLGKAGSRLYATIVHLGLAAGMILGGWLAMRLSKRYGRRIGLSVVPILGMTLGASFLGLGIWCDDIAWIVTWLTLSLAAFGGCEAPVWTMSVELGGRFGGTAAAIVNTGGNVGGFLAPILTPFFSRLLQTQAGWNEAAAWQGAIAVGCVLSLASAGLWWWIRPGEE